MEENVSNRAPDNQIQRRAVAGGGGGGGGGGITSRNQRYPAEDDNGGGDTMIKCSGKSCRSCAGGLIADCVALCCCPCAVVNILTLAFLKVPWMMGRKCLGLGKNNNSKKKLKSESKSKSKSKCCEEIDHHHHQHQRRRDSGWGETMMMEMEMEDRNGISRKDEGTSGIVKFGDDDDNYSARFEAEKVWLELYQVGHLGFGRVSFTGNGIQSIGKGNSGN